MSMKNKKLKVKWSYLYTLLVSSWKKVVSKKLQEFKWKKL